ncbi:TRAP transporter small permease [Agromyces silvae]|uniref:TRAP transporter small permease n=1 Tax=Agromyces silvae TaxID=3388266 RepID=UPI00280B03E1|nr:TRAP transporter small permease subunit [Agromyces protaetiae]
MTRLIKAVTVASATLAAVTLAYIAVATIGGVVLRYVFRQPNRFLFESTEFALALTVFLALGYVALRDRNVRVDLIPPRFSRARHVADVFSRFGTSVIAAALAWFAVQMLARDLSTGIKMGSTFGLPRWVLMLALFIGLVLLAANELLSGIQRARQARDAVPAVAMEAGGE